MDSLINKRLDKVYCRIKPSNTHGVGIFAIRDIPEGTNPFADSYIGQDSVLIEKTKIKNKTFSGMIEDYFPTNGNSKCIVPMWPNQIIWTNYINYTDDEKKVNIILDSHGVWRTNKLVKSGEELLEDPSDHFENGNFKVRYVDKYKNDYLNLRN